MTRRGIGYRPRRAWSAGAGLMALLRTLAVSTSVRTQGGQAAPQPAASPAAPREAAPGAGGRRQATNELTDFTPKSPYLPRSAADEAKTFVLPTGCRLELVASDPDVISPALIEFDGNGRMYVVELISYMMDAN